MTHRIFCIKLDNYKKAQTNSEKKYIIFIPQDANKKPHILNKCKIISIVLKYKNAYVRDIIKNVFFLLHF